MTFFRKHHGLNLLAAGVVGVSATLALAATPAAVPTDQEIAAAVENELILDQGISADDIDVTVNSGRATLHGEVDNLLDKQRCARVAQTVRGVRLVVNQIDVDTSWFRGDDEIRKDIELALMDEPVTEALEITANVDENQVTLTGLVDTIQEKMLAARLAMGVRGVEAIDNQINVKPAIDRPDNLIRNDVENSLLWDQRIDSSDIDVTVNNGKVMLTGSVDSAAERNLAIIESYLAGVVEVDASDLSVVEWQQPETTTASEQLQLTDAQMRTAIQNALTRNVFIDAEPIDVSVTDGVATLRGTVDTLTARRQARREAHNTTAIKRVNNLLKVKTDNPSDEQIQSDIEARFQRDPIIEPDDVQVQVRNDTAYLTGEVDTYVEQFHADEIAARVDGVKRVQNNLDVRDLWLPAYQPYVDPYLGTDFEWYAPTLRYTEEPDSSILEQVRDEIFWSPFVDASDVNVTVDDGQVTLTGTVDSWSEYYAASENAWEGGAAMVDNDLTVASAQ